MANFRQIRPEFWADAWVQELSITAKLLYLYLISNSHSNISGLYKITERTISFETGIDGDEVTALLALFREHDKVIHDKQGVMFVKNMLRFHLTGSPRLKMGVRSSVKDISDGPAKAAFIRTYGEDLGYSPMEVKTAEHGSVDEVGEPSFDNPSPFLANWIYTQVTGNIGMPSVNIDLAIEQLLSLAQEYKEQTVEELKPYWQAWTKRKTKEGKAYSRTSYVWLDWAVTRKIPSEKEVAHTYNGYTHA